MRHAFRFPDHVREAVRNHVQRAVVGVDPRRFHQEPAYTAALLGRLEGTAYQGPDGSVTFRTMNVNSIGPGAAESWSGADLAITAIIARGTLSVSKAILAQAKLGGVEDLSTVERARLVGQIRDMRRLTRSPKVLMIREIAGGRVPEMLSAVRILEGLPTDGLALSDYFVRRVLTTLDGDTRPGFVQAVQDSSLKHLRLQARIM